MGIVQLTRSHIPAYTKKSELEESESGFMAVSIAP